MRRRLGIVTIGQTPRTDVIPEMAEVLGPGVEIVERGALDGLDIPAVAAFTFAVGIATAGAGGHSEALLEACNEVRVIAFDRDPLAVARSRERLARFGARLTWKPFTLGHRSIYFRGFVGALSVGRLLIEILPKADRRSQSAGHHVWQTALALMLKEARSSSVEQLPFAHFRIHRGALLDVYIARFLQCVETLLHGGLARRYRRVEGNCSSFRGRLQTSRHIARNSAHSERFLVEYTTYDEQHLLNAILLAALHVVLILPIPADLYGRCRRCLRREEHLMPAWKERLRWTSIPRQD